jgi:aldose 1-epimerase
MLKNFLSWLASENKIKSYELKTAESSVTILNYGAIIQNFNIKQNNKTTDIILGFDKPSDYITKNDPYFGAIVGRTCNRIEEGKFSLGGKPYQLPINNGPNNLHGGYKGFDKQFWSLESHEESKLKLKLDVADKDQGYPGGLKVTVEYELKFTTLTIKTHAELTTGEASIVNLTSHPYFNLSGCKEGIENHTVVMKHVDCLELDDNQIPTGKLMDRIENPEVYFDKKDSLKARLPKVQQFRGFDHYYILSDFNEAVSVQCEKSGLELVVSSTCKGFQLYTGNWVDVGITKDSHPMDKYGQYSGFALEPSEPPNAINMKEYRDLVIVTKEKPWSNTIVYKIKEFI